MKPLDPAVIQLEISNLLLQFPELTEDEVLRADMVEGKTQAFDFLSKIVREIGSSSALMDGLGNYIKELGERKERVERRVDALRTLAFKIMETAELRKCELPEATLSIRTVPPNVIITDEDALPDLVCKFNRTPDKAVIKQWLSEGPLAGAELSNGSETISIRTK